MIRRLAILSTACVLAMQGVVFAATPAPSESTDSVTDVVAVFLASNLRQGIDGAVAQLQGYGIEVDRSRLEDLLIENLRQPYDEAAHREASQAVAAMIASSAARQSEQFLSQAAMRPEAETLPSGVVIETLTPGTGAAPASESSVIMRYTGTLPDGTIFDEMLPTDEPMRARVADLAPGLAEALTHMRAGGRYDVTIPAPLAYGSEGVPGVIPPDTPLRFTIDLIDVF